jgi:hypothetical protein
VFGWASGSFPCLPTNSLLVMVMGSGETGQCRNQPLEKDNVTLSPAQRTTQTSVPPLDEIQH